MLAYRLAKAQAPPEFQDVPDPSAGPGQVVVRVAGSGLCHTDFTVISREQSYWKDQPPPFTLGHEIAGWVEEVGTGVAKFHPGDAVAVNPSWGSCGRCHMCRSGEDSHCPYQKAIRVYGRPYRECGIGNILGDGGEYISVKLRPSYETVWPQCR